MNDLEMNKQLGTKWFTFYTKIRPWLSCIFTLSLLVDFFQYTRVYFNNWWLLIYFFLGITCPILAIMVFVKSKGKYSNFVKFTKKVLLFETFSMVYQQGVRDYINSGNKLSVAIIVSIIFLLIYYFVWYRLNVKYFEERIITNSHTQYISTEEIASKDIFCGKCGFKLFDDSAFCSKCGTQVKGNEKTKFFVNIYDTITQNIRKAEKEIDIKKFPPSKYATNEMYYAVEKNIEGKRVRVYCTKENWHKQIEGSINVK